MLSSSEASDVRQSVARHLRHVCDMNIVFALHVILVQFAVKKKERIVLREILLRTTGRHLSIGSHKLPDRGDRPAFTPTGQVGTRFIDPVRMKG